MLIAIVVSLLLGYLAGHVLHDKVNGLIQSVKDDIKNKL